MMQPAADAQTRHTKRRLRWWQRLAIWVVVIYLVWCAAVFFMQPAMLFPGRFVGSASDGPWRSDAVVMTHPIGKDQQVTAWLFPLPGQADRSTGRPGLAVYFHGNGELMDTQRRVVDAYHAMGMAVLMAEYRGYGHSGGKPTQRALVADALHFIERTLERDDVDAARLIYHGRSLGGAIAAQVASHREPAALVIESTFTHTGAFAWQVGVPPLPGIVRFPFATKDVLPKLRCPVLLFHGEADTLIPPAHSRRLHALTPGSRLVTYPGVGHNDFPGYGNDRAFWEQVRAFVQDP